MYDTCNSCNGVSVCCHTVSEVHTRVALGVLAPVHFREVALGTEPEHVWFSTETLLQTWHIQVQVQYSTLLPFPSIYLSAWPLICPAAIY